MHCKSLWIKASAKCINVNVSKVQSIFQPSTSLNFHHQEGSRTAAHPVRVLAIFCTTEHVQEKGSRDSSPNNCTVYFLN